MRFSVVTASFRQPDWLKCCALSVADQGVDVDHVIQDSGAGPELEQWVRTHTKADLVVEPDHGMYDALNRGFARANGEIFSWLNCDEQYLPGALSKVEARFAADPELEVLLADNVIVGESGAYVAHRFSLVPSSSQLWVRFPVASCALFFRPRVWCPFDIRWRSAADWWWFRGLLQRGAKMEVFRDFVSVFTETKSNLGLAPVTLNEQAAIPGGPALVGSSIQADATLQSPMAHVAKRCVLGRPLSLRDSYPTILGTSGLLSRATDRALESRVVIARIRAIRGRLLRPANLRSGCFRANDGKYATRRMRGTDRYTPCGGFSDGRNGTRTAA